MLWKPKGWNSAPDTTWKCSCSWATAQDRKLFQAPVRQKARRAAGNSPDYFPKDYLLFIDESHVTIPQLRAMYAGDRSRKETLVRHGFRLPSAFDNRPLIFEEFEKPHGPDNLRFSNPRPL